MEINLLSIIVAGVASIVIGILWYGPIFGKMWMKYMNFNESSMNMDKEGLWKSYFLNFIGALVMSYVLAIFISILGIVDLSGVLTLSLSIWLGFFASTMIGSVVWEGKSWGLYFINAGYQLVNILVASSILTFLF